MGYNKECLKIDCKYNLEDKCFCRKKTLPCVSYGNKERTNKEKITERRTGLSDKGVRAYKLHLKGWSFSRISKELKISKSTAYEHVKKTKALYKANKGVPKPNDKPVRSNPNDSRHDKRLHNDSVSFLIEPVEFWGEPNIIKLKYTKYLLIKRDNIHVQLFESKLIVRFLEDITAKTIRECKVLADERIKSFLGSFSYKGVRFLNDRFEQVSRHYAIIGTGLAKKYIREKKKFFVFDRVDGKSRLVIDNSPNGLMLPEFEAEHNKKGFSDGEKCEVFFDDLINKPHYLPSFQKEALDVIIGVQEKYAKNIELHLEVMREIKESMREIKEVLKR